MLFYGAGDLYRGHAKWVGAYHNKTAPRSPQAAAAEPPPEAGRGRKEGREGKEG